MSTKVETPETDPKTLEMESIMAAQKAEIDRLQVIAERALAAQKAELEAAIASAPASVRQKYTDRTLDPEKDLPSLQADMVQYQAVKAEAEAEAQQKIDAHNATMQDWRNKLTQKYGVHIPGIDAVAGTNPPPPADPPPAAPADAPHVSQMAELAAKKVLNFNEVNRITGGISTMSRWADDRQKLVTAGMNLE